MGTFSMWHWLVVLVVILIVFGAGKLPNVMGDLAKGIKSFKAGMKDDDEKQALTRDATPADQTARDGVKSETTKTAA